MNDLENASELGSDIDLEESWNQWSMRRREASDDGDGSSEGDDRNRRASSTGFDDDLDSAGRAPEEEDDMFFDELDALSWETEEFARFGLGEEDRDQGQEEEKIQNDRLEAMEESERCEEELKIKDKEALRVPTGPFYMHDDRFESGHSRERTMFGKFKDEEKWKHDKFEEIQEPKNTGFSARDKVHMKTNASNDSQIVPSRIVRGRGPVKYKPLQSTSYMPSTEKETYGSLKLDPEANCKPIESSSGSYLPKRHKKKLCCVNSNADQSPAYSNFDRLYPTTNKHALQQMNLGRTVNSGIHSEALFPSEAQHQYSHGQFGRTWMPRWPDNVQFPSLHHVYPNAYRGVLSQGQESSTGIASSEADANKDPEGTSTPGADVNNQSQKRNFKIRRYSDMKYNH